MTPADPAWPQCMGLVQPQWWWRWSLEVPVQHPLSTLQLGHFNPKPPTDGDVLPWGPVPELHNPPGTEAGPRVHLNPLRQVSSPVTATVSHHLSTSGEAQDALWEVRP